MALSPLHDAWFWAWHWYNSHGVPGNVAASALLGIPSAIVLYHKVWKQHIRPHLDRVREIHAHLDPSNSFRLGR